MGNPKLETENQTRPAGADTPLRMLMESLARPQPLTMAEYLAAGGSAALSRALSLGQGSTLDLIAASGFVCRDGRGAAGDNMRGPARADSPVVVCQAHRPLAAAFDRLVFEQCPHGVIEGMAIAAYATGAAAGCVCVGADMGSAVARALIALDECAKVDMVGESVLGSGFAFSVTIRKMEGPAAQSEAQLLASLNSCQTSAFITSPETFLHLRSLVLQGPDASRAWCKGGECGTKLVALQGDAGQAIDELPLGTDIVRWAQDKGTAGAGRALQIGHPLGRLVKPDAGPLALDAALLAEIGPAIDAGCIAGLGPKTCMVQVVHRAIETARAVSGERSVAAAAAFEHVTRILGRTQSGEAQPDAAQLLADLAAGILDLGVSEQSRAAGRFLLSALERFGADFELHVSQRRCPAATCELVTQAPCAHACPIGVNVPQFIGLITKKLERRAADLIRRRNPFPAVCGRMCHRPCEDLCVLDDDGKAISIRELERAAEQADQRKRPPRLQWRDDSGKKVVIVGAGPAGLSAAHVLTALGHQVVMYDREPSLGGLLASTVPLYLLPAESLERDLGRIGRRVRPRLAAGIETKPRLAQVLRRADAALLAVGMSFPAQSAIPGSKVNGVVHGLTFLRECRAGHAVSHGHVVVIGRGLVAAHAARCAARSGAKSVTWLLLDRPELAAVTGPWAGDLDAASDELDAVVADGVRLVLSPRDMEITAAARRVAAVTWLTAGGGEKHSAQRVVLALGRLHDVPFLPHKAIELAEDGRVVVDPGTGRTRSAGVFAAGECAHGPMRVAHAIASGVRAAQHMDRYLGGDGELPPNFDPSFIEDRAMRKRLPTVAGEPVEPAAASAGSGAFIETHATLSADLARRESSRCKRCRIFA